MAKDLEYYLDRFAQLHTHRFMGQQAPHKAVCLYTVIQLIQHGVIKRNDIFCDDTFARAFRLNWDALVPPQSVHTSNWHNPYWHLKHEGFWHLHGGLSTDTKISPSVSQLRGHNVHVTLDPELYELMRQPDSAAILADQLSTSILLGCGQAADGVIATAAEKDFTPVPPACPFCHPKDVDILFHTDLSLVFYDHYPVSAGHTLIIPQRHIANYFDLRKEEKRDLYDCADRAKEILDSRFHPDGYNLGLNIGEAAGQSIFHVHLHLIPRYRGDTPNPKGGVRGVIPAKMGY